MICALKSCCKELTGRQTRFCSKNHSAQFHVAKNRKRTKVRAVALLGGRCIRCGYSRCVDAMHFHHIKGEKEFGIGAAGHTRSWARVKAELQKCVLLCANCHAELHSEVAIVANAPGC